MWRRILVITLFFNICNVLALAQKANSDSVTQKVDGEKLKEVAAIREHLNKAFEEDAEKRVSGGKGVIVQPIWTQHGNKHTNTKVVVTQKNLKESAAIREEIQNAVNTGKYVKGESEFNASQADHYLGLKFRSKSVLSNMVGSEKDNIDKGVVGITFDEETDMKLPNVIESIALDDDIDIQKLKQLEMSGRRTREILVVKEIVEDLSFELGDDVKAWKHLEYDGREYYIGLRDTDLLIVQKDSMKYDSGYSYQVGSSILYFETFNYWNVESEKQEGIIIVVTYEKLIWYQVHSKDVFWEWFIGMPITVLLHFKIGNSDYVALSSNQSSTSGFSSLSIYQFDLRSKEFWMAQKLQLEGDCTDVAFIDTGRDTVLAVVQNNSASIFTFNPYLSEGAHIKFELKNTIESEGIQSVSAFRMGGFSYLAVGGLSPKILHYSQGQFVPKTILGQNFGLVELFLPIPARTYRDDMFLLVQHRVDFESHALVVLETLIWDGEVFDTMAPAPCIIGNYTLLHDISCLLDVQREEGIKGSAVLRKDENIFIIVPREKAESGLFQINTELLAKNSELMDLKEIFSFLKEWVNEHDELINDALSFLQNGEQPTNSKSELSENYSTIRARELNFDGEVGKIYLNEYEWTDEDMLIDVEDLLGEIERLDISLGNEGDIVRHRRELTYDTLDFENMETEDLVFQLLNGEKPYLTNSELISNNTVSFDALWVTDEIRLSSARSIRDTVTQFNEDLVFGKINGIKWADFSEDFVLRNKYFEIEELSVDGEIIAEGDTNAYSLNGLRFPDDYLWSSGPQASIVQADKYFLSTITAHAVDTGGLLNKVNPFDIISLTEVQNISGLTTFTQLEVSERMHVNGTVHGRGLTKFLSNPSLLDSNIIHSACTFHQLEVRGPIMIAEKYSGINMDELLNDVVYHETITNGNISIPSRKIFTSIEFQDVLQLSGHKLNDIPLNEFVTKHSIQSIDIRNISGNIYFNNVSVNGQFDSVNVSELLQNSIHVGSDGLVNAEVKFTDICWAKSVHIFETLNGIHNYFGLQEDINIEKVEFGKVVADNLITKCDIFGAGTFETENQQSVSENRNMTVYVRELILKSGLQTIMLNNIHSKSFISFLEHVDDIPAMIWEGQIIVNHIHTDGDVQITKLNNQNFDDDIQLSTIWLNRPNHLQTNLIFEKTIIVNGDLLLTGTLNEHNFSNTLQDMVFKSEPVIVKTDKHFLQNVKIVENGQIESVNSIPFTNIATKQTVERFRGNVYINNGLSVSNLDLPHIVNGQLNNFGKLFRFDEKINTLVLIGETEFGGSMNIESLYIHGELNSIGNVNEFFENLVYKNNICMLKGKTTFTNNVNIEKGAYIRNLNGYNMVHLIKNVVFINHPDPVLISASVVFKEPVQVKDLTIKGSLKTSNLGSCLLREWMEDTLQIDRSLNIDGTLQFAPGVINKNSLHTIYLNKMDTEYVVSLHRPQNISDCMSFSDIHLAESIQSGLVNGMDLQKEMENTLMVHGNARITSSLIMNSCDVILSFYLANGGNSLYNLNAAVSLREDLNINFPIFFVKINTNKVSTNSSITGIDFDQWHRNSLLTGNHQNIVTGNWSTRSLKAIVANVGEYPTNTGKQQTIMDKERTQLYQSFNKLCQESSQLIKRANKRVSFVKNIQKLFTISEKDDIEKVFFAGDSHRSYLIVNAKCQAKIFVWSAEDGDYVLLDQFNSGMIDEILKLPANNETFYLVTKVEKPNGECTHAGLNTWYFNQQKMKHLKSFDYSDISMIHPLSQNSNAFYAISENMGKILQLSTNSSEEYAWDLPNSGSGLYRFLPHDADLGVALSNGHHILLLNQPLSQRVERRLRRSTDSESNPEEETESLQMLERILLDLISSLNIQLLDTEFKLSEEHLENERTYKDFILLMQDIDKKHILPGEVFTGFGIDQKEYSHNPTIIFVARIVKTLWPAIEQIADIGTKLRSPELENRICGQILQVLTSALNEILKMGRNSLEKHVDSNTATYVTATASRIKDLQGEISDLISRIKVHLEKSKSTENDHAMSSELSMQYLQLPTNISTANPLEEPFIGESISENNFLVANSPHLPVRGKGEIVSIKAGINGNTRTLIATTDNQDELNRTAKNAIKIYFDVVTGSLFQTLSAYKPAYLSAFRIENESFLAFVEDKQVIRVLAYKGIRGFVEFLKFNLYEPACGLHFVSVAPKSDSACLKYFLIVNSRKNIDFYEILMSGYCSSKPKEEDCRLSGM